MIAPDQAAPPGSRRGRSLALAAAIGAVLFWLAVRQVEWTAVGRAIRGVSAGWLALGVLAFVLTHVLLAARWRILVDGRDRLPLVDAFDFVMIGALAGLVLPARLGDVARAVAAGRLGNLSASRLLGTILIERLLDVVMLLAFGVALSMLMPIPPVVRGGLATLLAAAAVALAVVWLGEAGPLGLVGRALVWLRGPLSRSLPMFARFLEGVAVVRERQRVPYALAAAAAAWTASAAASACHLAAFGLPVPWYAGAFVIVVINLGGIVPAPPAGLGVYHYLAMLALAPWVSDPSAAFAYAVVAHAVSSATVAMLGSASLARKGLSVHALRRLATSGPPAGDRPHVPSADES